MDLIQVNQKMYETSQRIDKATHEIHKMARRKAEAEYEYRKALSEQIMLLKDDHMSVTLIGDIARGNVADLKLERDLADGLYKSAIESLRALQSELSALQSINRTQAEVKGE